MKHSRDWTTSSDMLSVKCSAKDNLKLKHNFLTLCRLSNVQTQLPFDTRRTCMDLIQRLLGRAPDVPLIEASSITSPLQEPIRCKPIAVTKKRKTQENDKMVNGGADSDGDLPLLEDTMDL